ncbi:MAG: MarR family transcriptional regulator [Chloroflexia bacterium]|nr:MarR family transcriptional regulator [Chloroflexia bacterium]
MANDVETTDARLLREATEVERAVRAVYRLLRRPFDPDIARSGLTAPQMNALEVLTREDGLSLKELSGRMELSHSTVSGIIDRLERRELVERKPDQQDRRYSRIFLSEQVTDYVRRMSPSRRMGPISKALELASEEERAQIVGSVGTLRRLLERVVADGDADQKTETGAAT